MRIGSRARLTQTLGALGAFAEGRRHGEEALRFATLEGRGATPITAHGCLGRHYLAHGDLEHAIRVLEQGLALCRAALCRPALRHVARRRRARPGAAGRYRPTTTPSSWPASPRRCAATRPV